MFSYHQNQQLVYLTSSILRQSPQIVHCFSTRRGGVSTGACSSLNLGLKNDSHEAVLRNYTILADALGFRPEMLVFTHQVHTDIVRVVTRADCGTGLFSPANDDCDALITNDPGVMLTAFSADCCTILLHCPISGAVAAVHAGWRGTALGIARKTVATMVQTYGADPSSMRAAIGPCISQCCFETHNDVPDAMLQSLGQAAQCAIVQTGDKFHVDLKALNRLWLLQAGIPDAQIDTCPLCTACNETLFYSHRRNGDARGSLAALIGKPM